MDARIKSGHDELGSGEVESLVPKGSPTRKGRCPSVGINKDRVV